MHHLPTPWKHQKTRKIFGCFQGVENGCIGNEWFKVLYKSLLDADFKNFFFSV